MDRVYFLEVLILNHYSAGDKTRRVYTIRVDIGGCPCGRMSISQATAVAVSSSSSNNRPRSTIVVVVVVV